MSLYVVKVPDPPVGEDWSTMVPGQYLWNVTGVAGLLTAGAGSGGFPNCPDASGNGNDGLYTAGGSTFVPGLVPGNDALQRNVGNGDQLSTTHPIVDVSVPFTYLEWVMFDAPGPHDIVLAEYADNVVNHTGWLFIIPQGFPHRFFVVGVKNMAGGATIFETANGTVPYDSAPHMLAVTFDPAANPQNNLYLDGVLLPWDVTDVPFVFNGPPSGWAFNINYSPLITDELAIVPGALSGADIAALYAAGGSFATYAPAILARSPFVYYHLDGSASFTGREVALSVTDGTTEVALLGSGFPAVSTPGPYAYTWLPTATSNAQTPNGQVTTIAIPPLVLPAGYRVQSFTPDIQPGDQWSEVAVWWNDNVQQANDPNNRYRFPGPVRLEYRRSGSMS